MLLLSGWTNILTTYSETLSVLRNLNNITCPLAPATHNLHQAEKTAPTKDARLTIYKYQ